MYLMTSAGQRAFFSCIVVASLQWMFSSCVTEYFLDGSIFCVCRDLELGSAGVEFEAGRFMR